MQVKVTTVDGPVELKIPAGTQPGTTLLMAKRGVPRLGVPGSAPTNARGNHNVRVSAAAQGFVRLSWHVMQQHDDNRQLCYVLMCIGRQ